MILLHSADVNYFGFRKLTNSHRLGGKEVLPIDYDVSCAFVRMTF